MVDKKDKPCSSPSEHKDKVFIQLSSGKRKQISLSLNAVLFAPVALGTEGSDQKWVQMASPLVLESRWQVVQKIH